MCIRNGCNGCGPDCFDVTMSKQIINKARQNDKCLCFHAVGQQYSTMQPLKRIVIPFLSHNGFLYSSMNKLLNNGWFINWNLFFNLYFRLANLPFVDAVNPKSMLCHVVDLKSTF